MSEELKLNETVGAPQPDALAQIARKDNFLQQLQEFLAQHKGENWCVAAIDLEHFKLYTELYGAPQARNLMLSLAALLLEHSKATGSPVGYFGSDDFVLCLPDDREQQLAIISFDNSHYSSLGAVGLSSLAPDPGRLGSLAAQAILELVRGGQAQSQKLPWKLVTRKST